MNSVKYVGLDVHESSITAAVRNAAGELVPGCTLRTERRALLDFIGGLRGTLQIGFEEGTQSAWLYEQFRGRVAKLIASDPRKNALLTGSKSARMDARKCRSCCAPGCCRRCITGSMGWVP